MRRLLAGCALITSLALTVEAQEVDLSMKSKAVTSAAAAPKYAQAPFTAGGRDPLPELMLRDELDRRGPQAACASAGRDVCYDLTEGRLDFRPAREYMPRFDGLRAESVSLRHDRIIFKYSFK